MLYEQIHEVLYIINNSDVLGMSLLARELVQPAAGVAVKGTGREEKGWKV